MINCNYPRILIFGKPFNKVSGGGITLTNLFKGWEKNKIAVAYISWGNEIVDMEICDTYYQIGNAEHSWIFPFNIIKQPFPDSGLLGQNDAYGSSNGDRRKGVQRFLSDKIFNPFISWLGINHFNSRIVLSDKLRNWLAEYSPDILYIQVSTLEGIIFASQLIIFLKKPSVIHMMDDWPSTISITGPFKNFWKTRIDLELKNLLKKVDIHLSISEPMSFEYMKRYNKRFLAFHNPIESQLWLSHCKTDYKIDKHSVTILYSGRIGIGIYESLLEIASAIDTINNDDLTIKLHIQTTVRDQTIINALQRFNSVVINPIVDYEKIPEIFSKADILLLANDFSSKAINFLKFSMPTKASEYMISGTPVLVYSSEKTTVSKFFKEYECGYCLTSQRREEIVKAIRFMINDQDYREKISRNAVNIAKDRFDGEKVRKKFHYILSDLASGNINQN